MSGQIILAATPIGNISDAPARLWDVLDRANVIAAEDTRRFRELVTRAGRQVSAPVLALHDHNESHVATELASRAAAGEVIVVVSDAGMPTVSDPGFRVVRAAIAAGVEVTVVPGPSAALAALAVSGLATDRFTFEGFLPRKTGERESSLKNLAREPRTMIFFEAPHRLSATLEAMKSAWGETRQAAVCRELTKTFEETIRGSLAELCQWTQIGTVKGEIVVVVAGAEPTQISIDQAVSEALTRISQGERAKEVVQDIAGTAGLSSKELYQAVLSARSQS